MLESDLLRHSLTRLRTSSHRLEVEVGLWVKPERVPFEHRMCTTCNLLEDEYHFVIECQRYNDLRRKYIRPPFYVRPNMFKFLELLQSTNVSIVKNLALLCIRHSKKEITMFLSDNMNVLVLCLLPFDCLVIFWHI